MIDLVKEKRERAIVVGVATRETTKQQEEEYLEELVLLADTAGADVLHTILQVKDRFDSAYYIGKGKVEQLASGLRYVMSLQFNKAGTRGHNVGSHIFNCGLIAVTFHFDKVASVLDP